LRIEPWTAGAQEQDAGEERGRHERREQRFERQAEQRKQDECRQQHQNVQPPVACRRDHCLARQLCPMQEKQEGDSHIGEIINDHGRCAAAWQEACHNERPDQCQGKVVRQELES